MCSERFVGDFYLWMGYIHYEHVFWTGVAFNYSSMHIFALKPLGAMILYIIFFNLFFKVLFNGDVNFLSNNFARQVASC